jgi:hypothetical protein
MPDKNENPEISIGEAQPLMGALSDDLSAAETANEARAKSGWGVLFAYVETTYTKPLDEPVEQGVRDLLCDLQHTCDHLGLDFTGLLQRATDAFSEELDNPLG